MNENWVAVGIGLFLIVFGLTITHMKGGMPGGKPLYPAPLRVRLILIGCGALVLGLGIYRLAQQ
jgi:hypothetical protein